MGRRVAPQAEVARRATSGAPKWCIQTRLTITRAVSGLFGSTIALASSSRPLPSRNGLRSDPASTAGNCRGTASPRLCGLPRRKTRGSTGCGRSSSDHRPRGGPGAARPPLLDGLRSSFSSACDARSGSRSRSPIGFIGTFGGRPGRGTPAGAPPGPGRATGRARSRSHGAAGVLLPDLLGRVEQATNTSAAASASDSAAVGQGPRDQRVDRLVESFRPCDAVGRPSPAKSSSGSSPARARARRPDRPAAVRSRYACQRRASSGSGRRRRRAA